MEAIQNLNKFADKFLNASAHRPEQTRSKLTHKSFTEGVKLAEASGIAQIDNEGKVCRLAAAWKRADGVCTLTYESDNKRTKDFIIVGSSYLLSFWTNDEWANGGARLAAHYGQAEIKVS